MNNWRLIADLCVNREYGSDGATRKVKVWEDPMFPANTTHHPKALVGHSWSQGIYQGKQGGFIGEWAKTGDPKIIIFLVVSGLGKGRTFFFTGVLRVQE